MRINLQLEKRLLAISVAIGDTTVYAFLTTLNRKVYLCSSDVQIILNLIFTDW